MTELEKHVHIIEQLLEIAAETDFNFNEREYFNQTSMIMPVITAVLCHVSSVIHRESEVQNYASVEAEVCRDCLCRGQIAYLSGILKEGNLAVAMTGLLEDDC